MNLDADQNTVSGPVRSRSPIPSKATKRTCRAWTSSIAAIGSNSGLCVISDNQWHAHCSPVNKGRCGTGLEGRFLMRNYDRIDAPAPQDIGGGVAGLSAAI